MTPLEKIMAASRPNVETGCRVWYGKRDSNGEPKVRIRGNLASVKRYLTASKRKLTARASIPCLRTPAETSGASMLGIL